RFWTQPRRRIRGVEGGLGSPRVTVWYQPVDPAPTPPVTGLGCRPDDRPPSEYSIRSTTRRLGDRLGDLGLRAVTFLAAAAAVVLLGAILWKVLHLAWPAIQHYGLSFITAKTWDPVKGIFGALPFIYGTAMSSLIALVIATPLAIAIALWLSELAPGGVRGIVGSLVEMLAAIPSVVLGLWGILVLGPFLANHLEPWLHEKLGFIPLFGEPSPTGTGLFTAG